MNWFRAGRKLPSFVLLLAILAPVLLGVMPARALSAEQQLLRDTAINICSPFDDADKDKHSSASHQQCCILCSPLNHVFGATGSFALVIPPPLRIRGQDIKLSNNEIPPPRPDLRSTAPRGPPAI
jgi:hypothetical protein